MASSLLVCISTFEGEQLLTGRSSHRRSTGAPWCRARGGPAAGRGAGGRSRCSGGPGVPGTAAPGGSGGPGCPGGPGGPGTAAPGGPRGAGAPPAAGGAGGTSTFSFTFTPSTSMISLYTPLIDLVMLEL